MPPADDAQGATGSATAEDTYGACAGIDFDEVLARHGTEVYRYLLQLCRNRPDADDLYQETALKAFRAFGRLDAVANHRAWLYRLAGNTFLSDRRKHGRTGPLDGAAAEAIPSPASDEAARLDARDLLTQVDGLVAGLPKKQRLALIGRKYHDLSYAEIAASLNCSEDAARANVHAALRKLRDALGDRLA
ncbi:MAG TPA: sigma-70 family RNA polymerase sigma factor [Thermomicrobiales bacterium]|nr:sigma-70 family RNA polymerase sigma factor [Thermomicrobiales bacterium]